jgi:peptidoglycan/xylan/chitin deacetylase (PgdA/CDA1 family)
MSTEAIISLTFDDGLRCHFDKALPLLNRCRIPATFFLVANRHATHDRWLGHTNDWWKITWSDTDVSILKEAVRSGHEIGSHSVSHHPTQMELNPESEVHRSKELIEGWIGSTVNSFCYPFYRSHSYLSSAVRQSAYRQARGGGTSPTYIPGARYYSRFEANKIDRFNVDCRQVSASDNASEWIRPGCWHVLTFHGIGDERDGWAPISVTKFASLLEEVTVWQGRGEAKVLTFNDAVRCICAAEPALQESLS